MTSKKQSNPFSTGGGGPHFENHVQASYVTLMLTGGHAPCLPCWPIVEIKLQGKSVGFDTDDMIVYVENADSKERCKLLCQIKHSIQITKNNQLFSEVIQAAWSDFNNPKIFNKDKDAIALITGPLNATDYNNVTWLLEQARQTGNVEEFYQKVTMAYFSSAKKIEKLKAIEYQLKIANNNVAVSQEATYNFLKQYYLLGYDLGKEYGVVLSLIYSHISQFEVHNPEEIWTQIVDYTQSSNQSGGTITPGKLALKFGVMIEKPVVCPFPKEIEIAPSEPLISHNVYKQTAVLALVNLIGAWNEKNEKDISILDALNTEVYSSLILSLREILLLPNPPLELNNSIWKALNRNLLLHELGSHIFDQNLSAFKKCAVSVLTERDSSLSFPKENRFTANIYTDSFSYSSEIRNGLAEGLALIGSNPDAFVKCSVNQAETITNLTVREIFKDADWLLWGSLNNLLPLLAEASPDEFLAAVDTALRKVPCPFDELFSQESTGITGRNYLSGLLWALEALAWDEKYLVRVCVTLGELASHDPGGNWANRPSNSLTNILLPWFPQTLASIEKRKVAMNTLCNEFKAIAWKILINLLPNQQQVSTGTYKPKWRMRIPENCGETIVSDDYWEQVSFYSELAVSMAKDDSNLTLMLLDNLDNLKQPAFDSFLDILLSDRIKELSEIERLPIWEKLSQIASKHRRFSSEEWAMSSDTLKRLEEIIAVLAPANPLNLYRLLFSDSVLDLFDERGNFEEQQQKLLIRQENALMEIIKQSGIKEIEGFVEVVDAPHTVGSTLGRVATDEIDKSFLPTLLFTENQKFTIFIREYIFSRHVNIGWSWADDFNKTNWTLEQICQFLCFLPFSCETWSRVKDWLGTNQNTYWQNALVRPFQTEKDLDYAIENLIENGRPYAAIKCLYNLKFEKKPINSDQCVSALLAALTSKEQSHSVNSYEIIELIKLLQNNTDVSSDDLCKIEWAYLPLLDSTMGASPKTLENQLANDPEFFCEVIRLVFRSNKEGVPTNEPSVRSKEFAMNVWRLLHKWQTPPGIQKDGSFNDNHFLTWLKRVKELCLESGHLEVALITIGEVLIYCPPDEDGIWINHTVAKELNSRDTDGLRRGFNTGIFNSRGVHTIDPSGKPELDLSQEYHQKAEAIENAGYHRLATTIRSISEEYAREAEKIQARYLK